MTAHRFFLPTDAFTGQQVDFPNDAAHQIRRVLRLRSGDMVIALDGMGTEHVVRLTVDAGRVHGEIEETGTNTAEPGVFVTLYIGILKGSKLELVSQKCTEVGVSRFVPVVTERSVPQEVSPGRQRRFDTIVREAAEQSGRGIVPTVEEPRPYSLALTEAAARGPLFLLWENERETGIERVRRGSGCAGIMIGPEGGFTDAEVAQARAAGAQILSLGPRILRAETAAIVGAALVLEHLEGPILLTP